MRQIRDALEELREAGMPLAGALRLAALHIAAGDESGLSPLFAASLQAHGTRPDWTALRALVSAARALTPRLVPDGSNVVQVGDRPDGFLIVHQGAVRLPNQQRVRPMGVVGAEAALARRRYRIDAVAEGPTVLLHLPQAEAEALFKGCGIAARAFALGPRARRSSAPPMFVRRSG
ncbi:MAG: cyclic nucleotide-binding domain-containing protein [Myxococcales bacterium]|nr:cyclic nucleotide-binding domain-containing protein [Myxococcales bacterium]MCB9525760.1 cyclic nucleotide-binding domain-containing protein [Myxococcales bacterium]